MYNVSQVIWDKYDDGDDGGGGGVGDDDDDDDDNNDDDDNDDDGDDDGDDGGGGGVGDDDDDNDNDDNDGDDFASLYRHAQTRKEAHQKKIMAHPFSDYTDWSTDSIKSQFAVFIYIYLVLKKLVIRLSVDLTYVFHNTKQIWRAQVDFLRRRKLSDQNDLLENLETNLGIVF